MLAILAEKWTCGFMLARSIDSALIFLISVLRNATYFMLFKLKFFSREPLAIAILEMTMTIFCMSLQMLISTGCSDIRLRAFDGTVPPHFYGEMSKTEFGCQVLQEKGHFTDFAHFIRQHGLESNDQEVILKLKSILWAVVSPMSYL